MRLVLGFGLGLGEGQGSGLGPIPSWTKIFEINPQISTNFVGITLFTIEITILNIKIKFSTMERRKQNLSEKSIIFLDVYFIIYVP